MVGALRTEFLAWLLRPRIVHRLPGRLRLYIPALKHIGPAYQGWVSVWRDVLSGAPEIHSVEITLTTGTVLISYDHRQLTEGELLDFLRAINHIVLRHWDWLASTPPAQVPEAVRRIVTAIRAGIHHRLVLDDDIDVSPHAHA